MAVTAVIVRVVRPLVRAVDRIRGVRARGDIIIIIIIIITIIILLIIIIIIIIINTIVSAAPPRVAARQTPSPSASARPRGRRRTCIRSLLRRAT